MRLFTLPLLLAFAAGCSVDPSIKTAVYNDQDPVETRNSLVRELAASERVAVPTQTFIGDTAHAHLTARTTSLVAQSLEPLECTDVKMARQRFVDKSDNVLFTAFYRLHATGAQELATLVSHASSEAEGGVTANVPQCFGLVVPEGSAGARANYVASFRASGVGASARMWSCEGACAEKATEFNSVVDAIGRSGAAADGIVDAATRVATESDFAPFKKEGWVLSGTIASARFDDTDGDGFFDSETIYAAAGSTFIR